MRQYLLHVVIPAYGESPFLVNTLESIAKYLSQEVAITVLEDPSEYHNVEKLVKEFPNIDYLKNETRLGVAGNFNRAIEISKGIFTQICGSDDMFLEDPHYYLNKDLIFSSDIAAVTFDAQIINSQGKSVLKLPDVIKKIIKPRLNEFSIMSNKKLFSSLMIGDWIYFPATVWKTDILRKIKFDLDFKTAMDLNILLRLIDNNFSVAIKQNSIIAYRRHNQSVSSVYSRSEVRFEEEFFCHKLAIGIARKRNWKMNMILAQIAPSLRAHALLQSLMMFHHSPRRALKVLYLSLAPIR